MIAPGDEQLIGIEIGGTKLQVVAGNSQGVVSERRRFNIDPGKGAAHIRLQVEAGLNQIGWQNKSAIGVGFGGPVDWRSGTIRLSHQVGGWDQFNLKTWLQDYTGLPVAVDNDANTAALAEAVYGDGKGYENVFYLTVGSGIGGGMIMNRQIYHGRTPGEVEIGHTRLDKTGVHLESRCSGWAVNKKVREHVQQHSTGMLASLAVHHTGPEAALLLPALQANDAPAEQIISEVTDDLAFALSHVVHLFNPDIIIVGGGLSLLGGYLLAPLQQQLPGYVMKALLPAPPLLLAALSEDAVPIGALALAHNIFTSPPKL